ncbi:MAG: hypothetical protein Q4Q17_03470 [Tissierellia bacterium]|nr:hypothetical protein [Tissierellia bacterium]
MVVVFLFIKAIFAIVYLTGLIMMANYFFKKSYGNGLYNLSGMLTVVGIVLTGQVFICRAYALFTKSERSLHVLGWSRMGFVLFFILLNLFSYYMYIQAFQKKRYQQQQNIILALGLIAGILTVLPQNDYYKVSPGMLMPTLRAIPSILMGLYVSLILLMDGYYKRNADFQKYAALLAAVQVVHMVYAFILKADARKEFVIFAMICLLFILMVRIFYRKLAIHNALDRF